MKIFLKNILLSRKTALALVGAVGIFCFIGLKIPQQATSSPLYLQQWRNEHSTLAAIADIFHLHTLYSSELFLTLILLLVVVMGYSLMTVFKSIRKKSGEPIAMDEHSFGEYFQFLSHDQTINNEVIEALQKRGYVIVPNSTNDRINAVKNTFSKWGTVVLHGGMLIVIVASLIHFAFERRGFAQVIEGDTFFGAKDDFLVHEEGPLATPFHPYIALGLKSLTPAWYPHGAVQSLSSAVQIVSTENITHQKNISINHSLDIDGLTIYQSMYFGYTVGLILERNGERIPIYFSLDQPGKYSEPYAGKSSIPTTNYSVSMKLIPNRNHESFDVRDPILSIAISEHGRTLYEGTLSQGEVISFAGNTATFAEVRRWSGFIITESYGVAAVFAGFGIMLIGLLCIYFFPLREIAVATGRSGEGVCVMFGGNARREKVLFKEEFRELAEEVYLKDGVVHVGTELVEG